MKTAVVVNPQAGGGRCKHRVQGALVALRNAGWTLEVLTTTAPKHATQLARQAWERGFRRFVVVGGDGTSFEVLCGLPLGGEPPTLGFLPLGTGNSFIRDAGITTESQALQRLLAQPSRPCDVIEATHTKGTFVYLNMLSMGFAGRVGALTNRYFKGLGTAGYQVAVLLALAGLRPVQLPYSIDDNLNSSPLNLLSFCNSQYTGGAMHMAPSARIDDGVLDVVRVGPMGRLALLRAFPSLFRGEHVLRPDVMVTQTAAVRFDLDAPTDIVVDGEAMRVQLTALRVLPGAIRVML